MCEQNGGIEQISDRELKMLIEPQVHVFDAARLEYQKLIRDAHRGYGDFVQDGEYKEIQDSIRNEKSIKNIQNNMSSTLSSIYNSLENEKDINTETQH